MRKLPLIDILLALLAFVFVSLSLSGCAPASPALPPTPPASAPADAPLSVPRLRIQNTGGVEIKNLTVLFPESRITFGSVSANSISEYQDAPKGVYNMAAYEFEVDGQVVTQYVRDWVGESPKPGQSYTYVVSYDPNTKNIELKEVVAP